MSRRGDEGKLAVRLWRLCWLTVLVGHGLMALAWWWLQPGGFGVDHPRFWSNRGAPAVALGVVIAALAAMHREARVALRVLLLVWPAGWAGAAVAGRIVFPITLARLWLIPMAGAVAMGLAAIRPWRGPGGQPWVASLLTGGCSAAAGAAAVVMFRPPPAATHPHNAPETPREPAFPASNHAVAGSLRLSPEVMVQTSDGSLMVRLAPLSVSIQPLLRFLSRSGDGCPTVLVRPEERLGPEPRFRQGTRDGARSCSLSYDFPGQGPATLRVEAGPRPGAATVEAATVLGQPAYSHLNAFCDIEVRGHRRLALEFSPCPGTVIEVRPFDYPFGRPARLAFVQADRTFRVVEGSSGEKGPFRTLAIGRLEPAAALTITLYDEGTAAGRITLEDYAGQADTTLSPTAGWGVPVNALEFSLSADPPSSPASLFVTLAGTSVGRGWDCVAHAAGSYRNRIRLERVDTAPEPSRVPLTAVETRRATGPGPGPGTFLEELTAGGGWPWRVASPPPVRPARPGR